MLEKLPYWQGVACLFCQVYMARCQLSSLNIAVESFRIFLTLYIRIFMTLLWNSISAMKLHFNRTLKRYLNHDNYSNLAEFQQMEPIYFLPSEFKIEIFHETCWKIEGTNDNIHIFVLQLHFLYWSIYFT